MRLIALLVVLVLAGMAMVGRIGGALTPQPGANSSPSPTTRQVERAADAASEAERRRLDEAMKALR